MQHTAGKGDAAASGERQIECEQLLPVRTLTHRTRGAQRIACARASVRNCSRSPKRGSRTGQGPGCAERAHASPHRDAPGAVPELASSRVARSLCQHQLPSSATGAAVSPAWEPSARSSIQLRAHLNGAGSCVQQHLGATPCACTQTPFTQASRALQCLRCSQWCVRAASCSA